MRYLVSHTLFDGVWYLASCERAFLEDLSMFVQRQGYASGEKVATIDGLHILVQGVLSRAGAILTAGSYWGDAIISSPVLRDTRSAKTIAYSEVATITREHIMEVAKQYPKSLSYLRYAGLTLATKRSLMIAAMVARLMASRKAASEPKSETKPLGIKAGTAKWGLVKKDVKEKASPISRLLSRMRNKKKMIAFNSSAPPPPLDPGVKMSSILMAVKEKGALSNEEADEAGATKLDVTATGRIAKPDSPVPGGRGSFGMSGTSNPHAPQQYASGEFATLTKRVEELTKALKASETSRRADANEMLSRLAKLDMLYSRRFKSRRNILNDGKGSSSLESPVKEATTDGPLQEEDAASASMGHPPSRRRRSTPNRAHIVSPEAESPYQA